MTRDEAKRTVAEHFENWSRPIGVILFLLLSYLTAEGADVSELAWAGVIFLIGGKEIIQAYKSK